MHSWSQLSTYSWDPGLRLFDRVGSIRLGIYDYPGIELYRGLRTNYNRYKMWNLWSAYFQERLGQRISRKYFCLEYNQLIHMFSGPLGLNMNVGGDYEFIIMSATPDKVILQGKKYKNIMEMTPMPKDIPWRIQLEDIINIEKDAFLNTYRMALPLVIIPL